MVGARVRGVLVGRVSIGCCSRRGARRLVRAFPARGRGRRSFGECSPGRRGYYSIHLGLSRRVLLFGGTVEALNQMPQTGGEGGDAEGVLTQKRIVRPESSETLTLLPEVLGREMLGKVTLARWFAAPSSVGAGISVGRGKACEFSVEDQMAMILVVGGTFGRWVTGGHCCCEGSRPEGWKEDSSSKGFDGHRE